MSNARTPKQPPTPRKRVRVVKVFVKPVLMIDNGETLEEFDQAQIEVAGADWPDYSSGRFALEIAAFEEQLNAGEITQ